MSFKKEESYLEQTLLLSSNFFLVFSGFFHFKVMAKKKGFMTPERKKKLRTLLIERRLLKN